VSSWNLRDRHMAETLDALAEHPTRQQDRPAKLVVWAHNSHVGDARATEMRERGEINLGRLARERHPGQTFVVGFTTYSGTVTAASAWGGEAERKRVRPALPGSWEERFNELGGDFVVEHTELFDGPLLERAIGVIYLPESERLSHYFEATLAEQFDAVIHVDQTRALEPLERTSEWEAGEVPETYPYAL